MLIPKGDAFVAVSPVDRQLYAGATTHNQYIYNSPNMNITHSDTKQNNIQTNTMTPVLLIPNLPTINPNVYRSSPNIHILPKPTIPREEHDSNERRLLDAPSRAARLEAALNLIKDDEDPSEIIGATDKVNNCNSSTVQHSIGNDSQKRGKNKTKEKEAQTCNTVKKISITAMQTGNEVSFLSNSYTGTTESVSNTENMRTESKVKHKPARKKKENTKAQAQYFGALHRTMAKRVKLAADTNETERPHNVEETLQQNSEKHESLTDDNISENEQDENREFKQMYTVKKPETSDQRGSTIEGNGKETHILKAMTKYSTPGLSSDDILANHTLLKRTGKHNAYTVSLIPHIPQQCTSASGISDTQSNSRNRITLIDAANKTVCPPSLSLLSKDAITMNNTGKKPHAANTMRSINDDSKQKRKARTNNESMDGVEANVPKCVAAGNTSHTSQLNSMSAKLHTNYLQTTKTKTENQLLILKRLLSGNTNSPERTNQQNSNSSSVLHGDKLNTSTSGGVDVDSKTADGRPTAKSVGTASRKRKMESPQRYTTPTRQTYYVIDAKVPSRTSNNSSHEITNQNNIENLNCADNSITGSNKETRLTSEYISAKIKLQELLSRDPKAGCSTDEVDTSTSQQDEHPSDTFTSYAISGNHGKKTKRIPLIHNYQLARPMPITPEIYNYLLHTSAASVKPLLKMNQSNDTKRNDSTTQNTSIFNSTNDNDSTSTNRLVNNTPTENCMTVNIADSTELINIQPVHSTAEKLSVVQNCCQITDQYNIKLTVAQLLSQKRAREENMKHKHESNHVSPGLDNISSSRCINENVDYIQNREIQLDIDEKLNQTASSTIKNNEDTSALCSLNPLDHSYTKANYGSPSSDMKNIYPLIKQYESKYTKPISPLVNSKSLPHCARSSKIPDEKLNSNMVDRSTSQPCLKRQLTQQDIYRLQSHGWSGTATSVQQPVSIAKLTNTNTAETNNGQSPFALRVGNKMYVVRPIGKDKKIVSADKCNPLPPKQKMHAHKGKLKIDKNKPPRKTNVNHLNRKVRRLIKSSKEPFDQIIHSLKLMPTTKLKTKIRRAATSPNTISFSSVSRNGSPVLNSTHINEQNSSLAVSTAGVVSTTINTVSRPMDNNADEHTGMTTTFVNTMQIYKYGNTDCTYYTQRVQINLITGSNANYHRWFKFSDYPCTLHFNISNVVTQIDVESIKPGFYLVSEIDKLASVFNVHGPETVSAMLSVYPPYIESLPDDSLAIVIWNVHDISDVNQSDLQGHGISINSVLQRALDSRAFKDVRNMLDSRYASISDRNMSPKAHSVKFYTPELFECFSPGYNNKSASACICQPQPSTSEEMQVASSGNVNDKSNNCSGRDFDQLLQPKAKPQENNTVKDTLPPIYNKAMVLKMKRKQNALLRKCQQLKRNKSLSSILASLSQESSLSNFSVGSSDADVSTTTQDSSDPLDNGKHLQKRKRKKETPNKLKTGGNNPVNVTSVVADTQISSDTSTSSTTTRHNDKCTVVSVDVDRRRRVTRSQKKC